MSVFLPKGTRDLLPELMNKRLEVIDTVRGVFSRFGFEPLETPAFERIETLTGKYGDEGEKLIFRILKRGEGGKRGEVDLALRYDLTVPLARVIAMNSAIPLPFKRYQIQPVWRADRPQKGRFREFYQCDVDTVGTEDMSADAECLAVVQAALLALGFTEFTMRLNDRKILRGMVEAAGVVDKETAVLVAIDKLDKIGREGVTKELVRAGLSEESIATIWELLAVQGEAALDYLDERLGETGREGVAELRKVVKWARIMGVSDDYLLIDPTLARGLDYYTGPVFETVTPVAVGSISGGGRYNGLVGMFSGREVPAVGVSLGLERIITVMDELGMLDDAARTAEVMVTVFNDSTREASYEAARAFRDAGVRASVTLGTPKLKKQFKTANRTRARYVVVIGPNEAAEGKLTLKEMDSGDQAVLTLAEAVLRVAG
jgi:histidyl-tRNA synthetase